MFTDSSGAIYWADETYNGSNYQFRFGKGGDLKVGASVTTRNGIIIDNPTVTPTARTGVFNPVQKRVLSVTEGDFDWHMMIQANNGDLIWGDDDATDIQAEMFLSRSGNLNVFGKVNTREGIVVSDSNSRLPANPNNGDREFFRVNRGSQTWHMFTDFNGGIYTLTHQVFGK